ncbi:BatB protein [Achromatium sp. WMS2]|nr:BatB protein [Achromatium sp. WMS2]
MINLEWPWVLAMLPLPLLVWKLLPSLPPSGGVALRLPFYAHLQPLQHQGSLTKNQKAQLLLASIAWVLLVLAAARPQWIGQAVDLPISGRDLMLAVDISGSMQQEDYLLDYQYVSRLDAVKSVAGQFVARRTGDRLGLIMFGTRAYLQTPLTFDRHTIQLMLEDATIGLAGQNTAIGDAIAIAIKRLRVNPDVQKVLILLTDGTNTAGALAPIEAAKLAAKVGLRIYTIGIGGGAASFQSPLGMLLQRPSDLDVKTLESIARITGGKYFQAADTQELETIYATLDKLEPVVRDTVRLRPLQSLFMWPAGLALALAMWLLFIKT